MGNAPGDFLSSLPVDRLLSIVALVVGVAALIRVEWLFEKLYKREQYIRQAILEEFMTVLNSYAAFSRAMQFVEMNTLDLSKDSAFALFTVFRIHQLLYPKATPEQMAALRKKTRDAAETGAREYAKMLIKSGQGKIRDGFDFNDSTNP